MRQAAVFQTPSQLEVTPVHKWEFILRTILVIDHHPLIGSTCRLLLEATGIANILEAHDEESGYQSFLQHKPDVIITDLSLGGEKLDGLGLIELIRSQDPSAKILVFSMHSELSFFLLAIEAGASGYLIKDSPTDELAKAVLQVGSGGRYIDSRLALRLTFRRNGLSNQERWALALMMESTPYASTAHERGISGNA